MMLRVYFWCFIALFPNLVLPFSTSFVTFRLSIVLMQTLKVENYRVFELYFQFGNLDQCLITENQLQNY